MTVRSRTLSVFLLIFAASVLGCVRPEEPAQEYRGESSHIEHRAERPAGLSHVFVEGTEEEVIRAVQDGTNFAGSPDLEWFSALSDIWYERETKHKDFRWSVLKGPRVKVEIASQLAQAYRNGLMLLNTDDFRTFALENYADRDNRVARSSVVLLGELGDARDIELLTQLAQNGAGGRHLFKESVTALSYMCSPEAREAIEALVSQAAEEDRSFANSLLANREHVLRSWCR